MDRAYQCHERVGYCNITRLSNLKNRTNWTPKDISLNPLPYNIYRHVYYIRAMRGVAEMAKLLNSCARRFPFAFYCAWCGSYNIIVLAAVTAVTEVKSGKRGRGVGGGHRKSKVRRSTVQGPEEYSPNSQLTVLLYLGHFQNGGNRAFPENQSVDYHKCKNRFRVGRKY